MRNKVNDVAFSYSKLSPSSKVFAVASSRNIASSSRNDDFTVKESDYVFDVASSEMDNHADTHVFGRNFRVFFTTSKRCTVSPFLPEYPEQLDVPIVTGATAVDLENGSTVILIFGQGLWFGDRMDKSLINPNQCRHYRIPVCDDPTDQYRILRLAIDDNLFIPMGMDGTTCGFDSRCPTLEEMDSCKRVIVSHETDWDPSTVHFNVSSVEKENKYAVHAVSQFEDFSNSSLAI